MRSFKFARAEFGFCALGNFIFIVGGLSRLNDVQEIDSCERYDILTDTWEELTQARLPFPSRGMSLIGIDKRYIVAFGVKS